MLLTLGCVSLGGASAVVESTHATPSTVPPAIDEILVPLAGESSLRRRVALARCRFKRTALRVGRSDDTRRFAHWLPVQFRLMPPVWRGPTVLRL